MVSLRLVAATVCVGVAGLSFGAAAAVAKPVTVNGALLSYDKGSNILSFQVYPDTLKVKFVPGVTAVTGPDGAKVDIAHARKADCASLIRPTGEWQVQVARLL